MKRLLVMPLVLCALVAGAAPAAAGPPSPADGDWTYYLTSLTSREAGNTTFLYGTEASTFTGTFVGTAEDTFVVVCHQAKPDLVRTFVKGTIDFVGTVEGASGTMVVQFIGKQTSAVCAPSAAEWSGTWTVIDGTGNLADVHGQGTWTGPSFDLDYTGQIHFD